MTWEQKEAEKIRKDRHISVCQSGKNSDPLINREVTYSKEHIYVKFNRKNDCKSTYCENHMSNIKVYHVDI